MSLLLSLLAGCVVESQSVASSDIQFSGVELRDPAGNLVVAERAEMNPEGKGRGWEVEAIFAIEPGTTPEAAPAPKLRIEAERSQWDLKARTARFEGQVQTTRGDMQMFCNRLDVRLGSGDAIEGAVAQGEVRVEQGDRTARGQRAELFADRGELVITGSPVVIEGGNSLTGERIILWLDDDRLDCEACTLVMESPGIGTP